MAFDLFPGSFFELPGGARLRYAQFEPQGAAKGTVLAVPGRREFIEKKHFELQPLLARGYRLIVVEPRGQGLSTRFFPEQPLRQRDHVTDFNLLIDDLRAFIAAAAVPAAAGGPFFVHGHSMGGHLLLRWLAEDRPKVTGAFFTAPMLALAGTPAHMLAHGLSWASVRLFEHAAHYAPMQHDYGGEDCAFSNNPLTQDAERFPIIENYFRAHPELMGGGVTWGWLLAALNSMHIAHARHYLAGIEIPVLALAGGADRVTPAKEIAPYLNCVPRMQTHVIAGARHDILNEIEPLRAEAWRHIDAFMARV